MGRRTLKELFSEVCPDPLLEETSCCTVRVVYLLLAMSGLLAEMSLSRDVPDGSQFCNRKVVYKHSEPCAGATFSRGSRAACRRVLHVSSACVTVGECIPNQPNCAGSSLDPAFAMIKEVLQRRDEGECHHVS